MTRPLIGMPCDFSMDEGRPYHRVNEKYATSVLEVMQGIPVLIPAIAESAAGAYAYDALLTQLDGLIIPGAYSNVEPHHYGDSSRPGTLHDPVRDAFTLPLIQHALAMGVPMLAICRGLQEMNVVYGGTLLQHVQEEDGKCNHKEDSALPIARQYAHAHEVTLVPDGLLASIYPHASAQVNSLHGQGIKRLGEGLRVEATAPDGLIEAITDPEAQAFNLAVQWHPEYRPNDDDFYRAIYQAFTQACIERRTAR